MEGADVSAGVKIGKSQSEHKISAIAPESDIPRGSLATLKEHVGVENDAQAGLLWDELRDTFAAEMPKDLFRELFESRRLDLISRKEWPADKPLPDPEQVPPRALLESTLKEMNYVPTKMEPPKN